MPCFDRKVTIQLLPDPLPALRDYHEPLSLICREGRQVVDRTKNTIRVSVDVSGCKKVVVGIQPLEYIRRYNRTEKIRITVDVDGRRAVTHYYTVDQIRWCEGELLTDGINLFQTDGIIDVLFEPMPSEVKPSYRFQLLYSRNPEYEIIGKYCKPGLFRPNRNSVKRALWLLQNDPYSGINRQMSKERTRGEALESRLDRPDRPGGDLNEGSNSVRSGKRKIDVNERRSSGIQDGNPDAKERKTELIKENQELEEEIKRLRLIKEQKKLKLELKQLQADLDDEEDGDDAEGWHKEKRYQSGSENRRGESSRNAAPLLTPPRSIPSMDHLREREEADRSRWWYNRTA